MLKLLALAAAALWAAYIVLSRRAGRTIPGVQGTALASLLAAVLTSPLLVMALVGLATEHLVHVVVIGLATGLLGDSLATNRFMLGYAWQRGLVPISAGALERAIELNATVAVPEWNGKDARIMLEEDAFFDGEKTWYIDPRMEELLLIPRQRG